MKRKQSVKLTDLELETIIFALTVRKINLENLNIHNSEDVPEELKKIYSLDYVNTTNVLNSLRNN